MSIFNQSAIFQNGHTGVCLVFLLLLTTLQPSAQTCQDMDSFRKVTLETNTSEPVEIAIAGDGRVFIVERKGRVLAYKPELSRTVVAGTIAVDDGREDGLLGIALDPEFAANKWIYLFYSPKVGKSVNRLSRFTLKGDNIDMPSEKIMLEIPVQRQTCCHTAGSMAFGPGGELFLSTGDNTNPWASDGYSPIDERKDRSGWDAQGTAGNTNDLRGKILRIVPRADGSYAIPDGNLFPKDGTVGKPEIYVMGNRNPYRLAVDSKTGWLLWGEVGPDANTTSATRGPSGFEELNVATQPGNYGWPYFIGNNVPYFDYDFATKKSGALFNPASPVNESVNNTGARKLPPAIPATKPYPRGQANCIMAGPLYRYDPGLASTKKLPAFLDGKWLAYDFEQNWVKAITLDSKGKFVSESRVFAKLNFKAPIDMEIGPHDGALYLIEYAGWFNSSADTKIARIEYTGSCLPSKPIKAMATATPNSGPVPLKVKFSSAGSAGDGIRFQWSFMGDGKTGSTDPNPEFTYLETGNYTAQLTLTDASGQTEVMNVPISAGNSRPEVKIVKPVDGGFVNWGDAVPYQITVADPEDGSTQAGGIACADIQAETALGHADHAHGEKQFNGCQGNFRVTEATRNDEEDLGEFLFYIFNTEYEDKGTVKTGRLAGKASITLNLKHRQAEHFSRSQGVRVDSSCADTKDAPGGKARCVASIDHGDWISFQPVNLDNITSLNFRLASALGGGRIELRLDSPDGPTKASLTVKATGGITQFTDQSLSITNPGGTHELFLVFLKNAGDKELLTLNYMDFKGNGVASGIERPFARTGLTSFHTELIALMNADRSIQVPDGARGAELYDIRGIKLWEFSRKSYLGNEKVQLPAYLGTGLVRLRLIRN